MLADWWVSSYARRWDGVAVWRRGLKDALVSRLVDERAFLVELGRVDILVDAKAV